MILQNSLYRLIVSFSKEYSCFQPYLLLKDLATGATATDVALAMCGPDEDSHTASLPGN